MANPGYVRSTDGSDGDNGSTWALANATLAGAMADHSAGDRIWVSDNHAETQATGITITSPGTLASPCQILFGDDAAEPPTALTTSGSISATGTSNITVNGSHYWYGGTFNAGSGGSAGSVVLTSTDVHQVYDNTTFHLNNSNSTSTIRIGNNTSNESDIEFRNCTFIFGATGQGLRADPAKITFIGGGVSAASSAITAFINVNLSEGLDFRVDGFDFSHCASTLTLIGGSPAGIGKAVFRNCKMPSSWSGVLLAGSPGTTAMRAEMWNCAGGDTNYAMWVEDYAGSIKHETTVVHTGGASDGDTAIAWKMATTANAEYPLIVLRSPEIFVPNTTVGASKTLTVEILHFAQGAGTSGALQDNQAWLEVEYLGTSGTPLALFANDAAASVIATAADQTTTTEAWDSLTTAYSAATNYALGDIVEPTTPNGAIYAVTTDAGTTGAEPTWGTTDGGTTVDAAGRTWTRCNRQKLHTNPAITPNEEGVFIVRVCLAVASKTVYVDPKVVVS